jgi:hypothetical protein
MRSLKTITSEMKDVSGQKHLLADALHKSKIKITNPYDLKQLIYGVMIFALPLAVSLLWIEFNKGFILNPSWHHDPLYQKIIIIILIPVAYLGFVIIIVFVCIAFVWLFINEVFGRKSNPFYLLSYFFFSKVTHARMRRIEENDFTNEPELAHLSAELEVKKQAYDALKAEYISAEQEIQQRTQAFINSCEDEEVKEFLFEKTKKEE